MWVSVVFFFFFFFPCFGTEGGEFVFWWWFVGGFGVIPAWWFCALLRFLRCPRNLLVRRSWFCILFVCFCGTFVELFVCLEFEWGLRRLYLTEKGRCSVNCPRRRIAGRRGAVDGRGRSFGFRSYTRHARRCFLPVGLGLFLLRVMSKSLPRSWVCSVLVFLLGFFVCNSSSWWGWFNYSFWYEFFIGCVSNLQIGLPWSILSDPPVIEFQCLMWILHTSLHFSSENLIMYDVNIWFHSSTQSPKLCEKNFLGDSEVFYICRRTMELT